MWILEFLFFGVTLVVGWTLFGYFLFICFVGLFKKKIVPTFPEQWPAISVIVPCYNEQENIMEKLNDVKKIDYPPECLEVFFVDGGSEDETVEIISAEAKNNNPIRVIKSPVKGKINQINFVLPQLKGEIIVNTDVDAHMSRNSLKWIAAEFNTSEDIAVVGAYCRPAKTIEIERYYWATQNKGRFLENDAGTSSIVVAPCYAFKRSLLKSFPEDVVADDVYIAFLANTLRYRTVYSRHAMALETRSPRRLSDFIPHKFRKSNAFLRESLRFIYRLPEMNYFSKLLLITRVAQQLFIPWALLSWLLLAGVHITLFRFDIVIICAVFIFMLFVITSYMFSRIKLPDIKHRYSIITQIKVYILTNMIMLSSGLSYPFFNQGSSYTRLTNVKGETEERYQ